MPHNTHTSAAASCNNLPPALPSPRKTHKCASSAADTKCEWKKIKMTLVVKQEKKGGRKGKVAKAKALKGNKQGKNRCAYALFFSILIKFSLPEGKPCLPRPLRIQMPVGYTPSPSLSLSFSFGFFFSVSSFFFFSFFIIITD